MSDQIEKLKALIRELENELDGVGDLDDQGREVLQEALEEIQLVLESRQQPVPAAGTDEPPLPDKSTQDQDTLMEQLQQSAREFEGSHPTLTGILMRLIDGLGQMGI